MIFFFFLYDHLCFVQAEQNYSYDFHRAFLFSSLQMFFRAKGDLEHGVSDVVRGGSWFKNAKPGAPPQPQCTNPSGVRLRCLAYKFWVALVLWSLSASGVEQRDVGALMGLA